MCLALPGELIEIQTGAALPMGRVSFAGAIKDICLAYTPEAQPGDFIVVHAGFALSIIREDQVDTISTDIMTAIYGGLS